MILNTVIIFIPKKLQIFDGNKIKVKFKRLSSRARCPKSSTSGTAGYDLLSARNIAIFNSMH